MKPIAPAIALVLLLAAAPAFAQTDAIGTMMRKKIKPITDQIFIQLNILMNK